ncbi:MAG: DUF5615 family PIN-like protein [Cyanobacteria bacterium P01_D01_bin.44]
MKILIDMNLSPTWVEFFADDETEAVYWSVVGDPRASDRTLMQWASECPQTVARNACHFV